MKNWIEKNCVFTSHAGRELYRRPAKLMPWQSELLNKCFSIERGELKILKPKIGLFGCRKIGKSMLFSWILSYFLRSKNLIGWSCPIVARSYEQGLKLFSFVSEQILLSKEKKTSGLRRVFC